MHSVLCSLYDSNILKNGEYFFKHFIDVYIFKRSMFELNLHIALLFANLNLNNYNKKKKSEINVIY